MNKNAALVWAYGIALASGAATLYLDVRQRAVRLLKIQGNFNEAAKQADDEYAALQRKTPSSPQNNEKLAGAEFNQKKNSIIHAKRADTFKGAWKILPQRSRTLSLIFSGTVSTFAGLVTYLGIKSASRRGSSRRGGSSGDGGYYAAGGDGGGGGWPHHGGGHFWDGWFGHGGGFDGGGFGDHGGGFGGDGGGGGIGGGDGGGGGH